ncbi:hypothetical protein G4B88_012389 [Cannabis sativa]|uniref:Homeobox domain-containing protein n=1 Tax=Cannabis sativa TaxID=3483 RepID=A0A7J6I4S7_CANSA|nr:hypothetical protein G4B88_012389 [Cannabis sativa]
MGCRDGNEITKLHTTVFNDMNNHHQLMNSSSSSSTFHTTSSTPLINNHYPDYSNKYKMLGPLHHHHHHHHQNSRSSSEVVVGVPMQSSRWTPTPEQLLVLEELYQHGKRTPTAQQIQEITIMLRRFGKIEGKNVFYWFQNHKARDKRKRRKLLEQAAARSHNNKHLLLPPPPQELSSVSRVTGLGVEQTKQQESIPYITRISEEFASVPRVAIEVECTNNTSSAQLEEKELGLILKSSSNNNNNIISEESYATWNPMEVSYSFPPANFVLNWARPTVTSSQRKPLLERTHEISNFSLMPNNTGANGDEDNDGSKQSVQTLELFPLRSDNVKGCSTCTDHTNKIITSDTGRDSDFKLSLGFISPINNEFNKEVARSWPCSS